ncbi:MAG: RNase adapter RapZ [Myxococcales bacterium]|nr:RNase adapter RapZ [Myxococcales bacterium]
MSTPAGEGELKLLVITGLSGSGISTAIHALEDLGFFCVDNLPPPLLPKLIDLARQASGFRRLAMGLDARNVQDVEGTLALLDGLSDNGLAIDILFLEASDATLLRRFSVSRRPHPLGRDGLPIPDAIRTERLVMHPFRERARMLLDTSDLNVHECKRQVQGFATGGRPRGMAITVMSFGFRHGVPAEADIVWDVRFLKNPHFDPVLRPLSGSHPDVAAFVLEHPTTRRFLERLIPLLDDVLPAYEHEGKSHLTIAVGCTGGRHRSVAIAERLHAHLQTHANAPKLRHRDIHKEPS